jgi:hypothetical protein
MMEVEKGVAIFLKCVIVVVEQMESCFWIGGMMYEY